MEVCPYRYFWWCRYLWGPWVSFGTTDEFSVRVTKLLQGVVSYELTAYLSVFDLFLTQWVMALMNVNHRQLWITKLSKTWLYKYWSLCLSFVDCESLPELNSPDYLLYVRLTWMIQWVLAIYLWGVVVVILLLIVGLCSLCEGRTSFCIGPLENSAYSYLCYNLL